MEGKCICLCSGGLDSTLALLELEDLSLSVTPMYLNYGHWATAGELPTLRAFLASWKIEDRLVVIESSYDSPVGGVWGRTIAAVGLAAMWAFTNGNDYSSIAVGSHLGDVCPDCKPGDFDRSLDATLRQATMGKISLTLPLRFFSIEDIGVRLFLTRRVDPSLTYSCYWYPPCGYKSDKDEYRCPGCRRKVLAMKAAGIDDPVLLDLPNCKERSYYPEDREKVDY